MPDELYFFAEPVLGDEALKLCAIVFAAIAGEDHHRIFERAVSLQLGRRGDQVALALDAGETRGVQHDLGARSDAPFRS